MRHMLDGSTRCTRASVACVRPSSSRRRISTPTPCAHAGASRPMRTSAWVRTRRPATDSLHERPPSSRESIVVDIARL